MIRRKRLAGRFVAIAIIGIAIVFAAPLAHAEGPDAAPAKAASTAQKQITVFAASSLQEAFAALAARFTHESEVQVRLSFAGSQELRTQIEEGARADVFASADLQNADALESEHLLHAKVLFASNRLIIVVPKGNPDGVHELADLSRVKHLVIGAHEVPVGAYAEKLFALADARSPGLAARIESRISSRELNVRQVLAKVALGEADAGIVYRTDARAMADRVDSIEVPMDLQARADYPIAVLEHAPDGEDGAAFVAFVLSKAGQDELRARGFLPPGAR